MKKLILAIMSVMLCLTLSSCTIMFKSVTKKQVSFNTDISNYEMLRSEVGEAKQYLPSLNSLNDCENKTYSYQSTIISSFMGFYSETIALFVKYDSLRYNTEKSRVLISHNFLLNSIRSGSSETDNYLMPVTGINYNGYYFKVVSPRNSNYSICKSFMMIGYDDANLKIAYLYFYDPDLDYIATYDEDRYSAMRELLNDYFHWNDVK